MMLKRNRILLQKNIKIFFLFLILALFVVLLRVFWLQCIDGNKFHKRMSEQVIDFKEVQSSRGNIYDRTGKEMAVSVLVKSLCADPREINQNAKIDLEKLSRDLSLMVGVDAKEIFEKLDSNVGFVWIKRKLEPSVSKKIEEYIKENHLSGLFFLEESKRYYPNENLAAQVIGFVGTDDKGLEGLELAFDDVLRGERYEQQVETDSRGIPVLNSVFSYMQKKQSKSMTLTIDTTMQFLVEQAMDKAMQATQARAMTVIIMEPKTGEILVMANKPSFNPNAFYKAKQEEMKNRAVNIIYEPGSTFKTVVAGIAVNEGIAKPNDLFFDSGSFEVMGRRIRNWSGESYGQVTFSNAVEQSLNTVFAQIGQKIGKERISKSIKEWGFGKQTGLGLAGEEAGILFDLETMTDSDLASVSIGQGLAVTPIQLVTAISAIANGGKLLKPYIVKEIRNADGTLDKETKTEVIKTVLTPEADKMLVKMLENDIEIGGGGKAKVEGYRFAGKTGTAERLNEQGTGYASGQYIASFVGFGPLEEPQFAVLVLIDTPVGVYYGGQIAAPLFADFMAQIVRYKGVPQSFATKIDFNALQNEINLADAKKTKKNNENAEQSKQVQNIVLKEGQTVMPNLIGKTIREAGQIVNVAGLRFAPDGSGFVVYQNCPAGTVLEKGAIVSVYCEN